MSAGLYRIPKRQVRAQVRTIQRDVLSLHLFLGDRAETHGGAERPSDLFNGTSDFIVVQDENGEVFFLNRNSVSTVTVSAQDEVDPDLPESAALAHDLAKDMRIAILLDDGDVIQGSARYQLPEAQSRVLDFLNTGERFLPLRRPNAILLVNKQRISRVTQLPDQEESQPCHKSIDSSRPCSSTTRTE